MGVDSGHCQFAYPGIKMANCVLLTRLRKQPLLLAPRRWGRFARTNGSKRPQRRGARRSDCFPRLVYDVRTRRAHGKFGRRKTQANKLNLKKKTTKTTALAVRVLLPRLHCFCRPANTKDTCRQNPLSLQYQLYYKY